MKYEDVLLLKKFLTDFPNTYILKSNNVIWGGYSMVDIELKGIEYLIHLDKKWDVFINLSGQDYPLKSQESINNFLYENKNKSFIQIKDQYKERPETENRITNFFLESEITNSVRKLNPRPFLEKITPYIGTQWMILTRECCEFINTNTQVQKFKDFYLNTLIPDESFFQTVLMNSEFKGTLVNDDKRAIIWIPDGDIKLRPKTFDLNDLDFLMNSDKLFARKFDDTIGRHIIDRLQLLIK